MAWSEAKAWTRGKATGKIYQDLLDDATNAPSRNARRKKVVRPEDMQWEMSRQGLLKHLINEQMNTRIETVDAYMQIIPPGSRSGKHRHLAEECVYVLEGRGYDLHQDCDVEINDVFEWTAQDEVKRYEWEAGDVIYISGAAGAVGNMAGQLAKLRGCRVIGSAGSDDKVKRLINECGFDAAFNYKTGPVLEQLNLAAPDGIDVYFDNVGGESLEAALSTLRVHGRIIGCGGISSYNDEKPKPGPSNLFNMTTKRLTMKGLIVGDWLHRQSEFEKEVGAQFQAGKLKSLETVVVGIDQAVDAFIGLFDGKNIGKMVVKLAP